MLCIVGCASQQSTVVVDEKPEPQEETYAELVCEDNEGNTLTCMTDNDCCEGFSCIVDRSISRSKKFCVYDD